MVDGYENNPNLDIDWEQLDSYLGIDLSATTDSTPSKSTIIDPATDDDIESDIVIDDIGIVNSFGQEFDEIKTGQVLQVAANVSNPGNDSENFVYTVEILDDTDSSIEPIKWVTGTINPDQTFNVGLSWIPKQSGDFKAIVAIGDDMNSLYHVANIDIEVSPEGDLSDNNYCKNGYELLFKYSDNSPICATSNTALKLLNMGLVFD